MDELKACSARAMWDAMTELEDMAMHQSAKKQLSAETLAIAITAIQEKAEQNRRPAPENKPLTLEQLRRMGGEPVWIDDWFEDFHGWELSTDASDYLGGRDLAQYGSRWLAYARKPEEATT